MFVLKIQMTLKKSLLKVLLVKEKFELKLIPLTILSHIGHLCMYTHAAYYVIYYKSLCNMIIHNIRIEKAEKTK